MFKLLFIIVAILASGCTTYVHNNGLNAAGESCFASSYEVTVDSWCGNGCDSYPVSHRMRDTRVDSGRVELNGTGTVSRCVGK